MKETGIAEARRNLPRMVDEAFFRGEHWVLTKSGEPRAVLVGFDDFEELTGRLATLEELSNTEARRLNELADADIVADRLIEHDVVMARLRDKRRQRA